MASRSLDDLLPGTRAKWLAVKAALPDLPIFEVCTYRSQAAQYGPWTLDVTTGAGATSATVTEPVAVSGATSSTDTSRKFASNQHAEASIRPQLLVTYTTGIGTPATPTISAPGKMRASTFRGTFH